MTVFWVVAPCILVEVYRRFRGACPEGDSEYLCNVGKLPPRYTALQLRRHSSSYSLPWEPETAFRININLITLLIQYLLTPESFKTTDVKGLFCCHLYGCFIWTEALPAALSAPANFTAFQGSKSNAAPRKWKEIGTRTQYIKTIWEDSHC
jgi:hypothetical protein